MTSWQLRKDKKDTTLQHKLLFHLEASRKYLELLLRKTGCFRTPSPSPSFKKKHVVTIPCTHGLTPPHPPYTLLPKHISYFFLTVQQRSKENLSTPGVTQGNLVLTLTFLNKQKQPILNNPNASHPPKIKAPQKRK